MIDQFYFSKVIAANFLTLLDLIQDFLILRSWDFLRLDGKTSSESRQQIVDRFNSKTDNAFVFLLSTKAGGVGLNL